MAVASAAAAATKRWPPTRYRWADVGVPVCVNVDARRYRCRYADPLRPSRSRYREPSRAEPTRVTHPGIVLTLLATEPIRTSLRPPRSMCRPRDTIRTPAIIAVRGGRATCSRRNRSHQSPPALNSQARITPSALIAPRFYDLFYFFFFFWLFVSSLDKSFFEREEKRVYGIMLCIREGDAR